MAGRTKKIYQSGEKYLRELRRAPESRKKRWLIVSSSLTMLVVLGLWLIYLNFTLPALTPAPANTTSTPAVPPAPTESFFQTFNRGLQITAQNIGQKINDFTQTISQFLNSFQNQIQKTNKIEVQPPTTDFTPNTNQNNIPTTTLP